MSNLEGKELKELKEMADLAGIEYKKNAGKKKMLELLNEFEVEFKDVQPPVDHSDGEEKSFKGYHPVTGKELYQ